MRTVFDAALIVLRHLLLVVELDVLVSVIKSPHQILGDHKPLPQLIRRQLVEVTEHLATDLVHLKTDGRLSHIVQKRRLQRFSEAGFETVRRSIRDLVARGQLRLGLPRT